MNSSSESILIFIEMLARVRELFRTTHIEVEKNQAFSKVVTTVSPFRSMNGELEDRVSFSFFLDAELASPENTDQQSLGVSVVLKVVEGKWTAQGEIGWTGSAIGWDNFIDHEYVGSEEIDHINDIPVFTEELLKGYRRECDGITRGI